MTGTFKYSYLILFYWIIYIPPSIAFEMTTHQHDMKMQQHEINPHQNRMTPHQNRMTPHQNKKTPYQQIPEKFNIKPVPIISKPLKLQLENKIQVFEKKKPDKQQISSFDRVQMDLIQARILARKGQYAESMNIYEHLVVKYPKNLDIRADYADVLLENGVYEKASVQIQYLLNHQSYRTRGLQMMAVLYDHQNLPSWTFPIYEELLNQNPNNDAIWMNYGNQRNKAGQWQKALNAYSRVLENDPENIYALRDIHNILREKRPAMNAQFLQVSGSDKTVQYHHQYIWRYTLTQSLTFRTLFEQIDYKIPENLKIIPQDIQQITMEFRMGITSDMIFTGRLFNYTGPVNDVSFYGALSYRLPSDIDFQISYLGPSSWYDPIQAMAHQGSYEEYNVMLSKQFFESLRFSSSLAYREYALAKIDNYGNRLGIHMDVSRRLLYKPDITLILALDQGHFTYNTDKMNVPMVLDEKTYSISTYIQDQPFGRLYYFLSAGYRWDSSRSLSGFFVNPGIGWHFSSQFQIDGSYSYSSESTGLVQGSTQTYLINGMIIF